MITVKSTEEIDNLRIIDINGKVMYELHPTENEISIPTSGLNDGVYILEILNKDNYSKKKFIIQHP
jgi:hypothetical protein